jgi:hypothetical protein
MHVSALLYSPFDGGPRAGLFALSLLLGGARAKKYGPVPLVRELDSAAERVKLRSRVVSIECGSTADLDEGEMTTFLRLTRDHGFKIHLSLPGQEFPTWLDLASYKVAELSEEDWPGWAANEIRYFPGDTWAEPKIYPKNADVPKYVVPGKRIDSLKLLSFLESARFSWGVILEPKQLPALQFIRGEEE